MGQDLERTVGPQEPGGLRWLSSWFLLQQSPHAASPLGAGWAEEGQAGRATPSGALAWRVSLSWVGLLTRLLVLGSPASQQFREGGCLREKCVPGPLPPRPAVPEAGGSSRLA